MNDPSGLDPKLLDLLVEWEERNASDAPVSPEELCQDCPEHVEDLRRQVELIARIDPLLALAEEALPATIPGFELLEVVGRGGMGLCTRPGTSPSTAPWP